MFRPRPTPALPNSKEIRPVPNKLPVVVHILCAATVLLTSDVAFSDAGAKPAASALQSADRMIERCLAYAATSKLPALSVVVVDASGALIAFKRQDGAMPASGDAALLKARSAIKTRVPTALLAGVANDAATRDAFQILQLTWLPGGAPYAVGDNPVAGAIGVSGAQPDQDAACAQQAVAEVTK
jgi:glc operon protein GlcG